MVKPAGEGATDGRSMAKQDRIWAVRYYDTETFYHTGSEPKLLEESFSGGSHTLVYRERYEGVNTSMDLALYEREPEES